MSTSSKLTKRAVDAAKPGDRVFALWDIRKCAGIDDVRIHDLRYCFASIGAVSGLSLPMIGALLGHKDIATTQRYAHLSDNPVRSAADQIGHRLNELLKPNAPSDVAQAGNGQNE